MLNEALRLIRVFHDVSQKKLAARLQIMPPYLSEIEAGKKEPTISLIRRYSEEFDIPMSSILFFAEHIKDTTAPAKRLPIAVSEKIVALLNFIVERDRVEAAD